MVDNTHLVEEESGSSLPSPSAPSGPRLPPELCDMIIDQLSDDKKTLAKLSVISRAWSRTARLHLFEAIVVTRGERTHTFRDWVTFLKSKPDVLRAIKDLCIDGWNRAQELPGDIDARLIATTVSHLPSLQSLMLLNCSWKPTKPGDMDVYAQPPVRIRDLYINGFKASRGDVASKLEVLRHFSYIDRLFLSRLWLGHFAIDDAGNLEAVTSDGSESDSSSDHDSSTLEATQTEFEPITHPKVEVRQLILSTADICLNFLEHLRRQPFLDSVTSLSVFDLWEADYLENMEDLTYVGEIIRDRLSKNLQNVQIDMPRHGSDIDPVAFELLHLDKCPNVEQVTLNMYLQCTNPALSQAAVNEAAHDAAENPTGASGELGPPDGDDILQVAHPHPLPPPPLFTRNEWLSLLVILKQLPLDLNYILIGVELRGSDEDVHKHLQEVPDWEKLEAEFMRFPKLERLQFSRLGDVMKARAVEWNKADRALIANKLKRLVRKKVLGLK